MRDIAQGGGGERNVSALFREAGRGTLGSKNAHHERACAAASQRRPHVRDTGVTTSLPPSSGGPSNKPNQAHHAQRLAASEALYCCEAPRVRCLHATLEQWERRSDGTARAESDMSLENTCSTWVFYPRPDNGLTRQCVCLLLLFGSRNKIWSVVVGVQEGGGWVGYSSCLAVKAGHPCTALRYCCD